MYSFRRLRVGALVLALVALPNAANAETLRQALTGGYVNNPEIMSALLSVKATAEGIVLAKSGTRPSIGASASATESFTSTGGTTTFTGPTVAVGLSYNQTLFDNFKTDAGIDKARALTDVSRYQLQNAEQNVLLSVVQSYMNVLRDTQLVQLRQESVKFYQAQVSSSNERLKIGEGTKIDVSQADARLAQATASYKAAIASLQTSRASYERWVGHAPRNLSDSFAFGGLLPKSLDTAINAAVSSNPAILIAKAQVRAAAAGADAAAAGFGPTLDLIGSIGASKVGTSGNVTGAGSVKLSLSIPLYAGGALGASMRQANLLQIKSEVDTLDARDKVKEAVISAWSTMQSAAAQIESANAAVASGQLVLEGVVQERDVGQATTLDVLNTQAELTTVREALIQARSNRVIASFAVLNAMGRLTAGDLGLNVEIKTADGYIAKVEDVWAELRALN